MSEKPTTAQMEDELARMQASHDAIKPDTNLTDPEEEAAYKARIRDSEDKMRIQRKRIAAAEASAAI
jgi:capsule polysaccharide export protein KpsE/RkpR